jgi:CheY-like chemotaxis protein
MLLSLINNVLDASKMVSNSLHIRKAPFSVHTCVSDVVGSFKNIAIEKHIDLSYQIASDVPWEIVHDILRVRQVLCVLIENAIKFTQTSNQQQAIHVSVQVVETTGRTRPRASSIDKTRPKALLNSCDNYSNNNDDQDGGGGGCNNNNYAVIQISVSDSGIGVPENFQELIFNYTQLDSSSTRRHSGAGLGLTISKKIVNLMQGELWVESAGVPGLGSKFSFSFPCEVTKVTPQSVIPTMEKTKSSDKLLSPYVKESFKFLIVDDNVPNLKIMQFIMKKLGVKNFKTAENGVIAVEVAKEYMPDLIFMDVNMPVMDGLDATRIIKDHLQSVIIVGVTAYAYKKDVLNCIGAGMNDVLPKPIKLDDISNAIIKWTK